MPDRPHATFQGVAQIVRFNWPLYLCALLLLAAGSCVVLMFSMPFFLRVIVSVAVILAAFWLSSSLIVSHYIYDLGGIYDGAWGPTVTARVAKTLG
jgi:hypothetical protein